ncbi:hypothetical protein [Streptomyces sp. NPDC054849]
MTAGEAYAAVGPVGLLRALAVEPRRASCGRRPEHPEQPDRRKASLVRAVVRAGVRMDAPGHAPTGPLFPRPAGPSASGRRRAAYAFWKPAS